MTKSVFVTFDGKAFVPDDPTSIRVGTKAAFDVDIEEQPDTGGKRVADALAGLLSPQQADELLNAISESAEHKGNFLRIDR